MQWFVIDIIDSLNLKHEKSICHQSNYGDIIYEVDKFVAPDFYTENIDMVCANGIHYFLSLEAAYNYHNYHLQYYDNGQLYLQIEQKDALNHGICVCFYSN